jgi:hypothetical protein
MKESKEKPEELNLNCQPAHEGTFSRARTQHAFFSNDRASTANRRENATSITGVAVE